MDKNFSFSILLLPTLCPVSSTEWISKTMQMKSSMTSIRVIYVHREREKIILKAAK